MTTKTKCRACQWWNATKEDGFFFFFRPLDERYAKQIKEKYDAKRKI